MAPAGYSGTPLPKKLGIKDGHRVLLLRAPEGFDRTLGSLPDGTETRPSLRGKANFDVAVVFCARRRELEADFERVAERLEKNGGLWVAWPKKASGIVTDFSEADVRAHGLAAGLVDNKICAVDETWSGLRFVYRVKDR